MKKASTENLKGLTYHAIPSDDQITIEEETQRYTAMMAEEFNNELNPPVRTPTKEQSPLPTQPRQRKSYQSIMNQLLMAGYEHVHGTPKEQERDKGKGKAPTPSASPTSTEPLHPGFPFREKTDNNNNLPPNDYERPYLAAQVHALDGDPRVIETNGINQPLYDEAKLTTQPTEDVDDDMENEVSSYPFGENAYLDPGYLQALGTLGDRGLTAEGLRLVQLESEFRYLGWWEMRLADREHSITWEQGELIRKQQNALKHQTDINDRL